MQSMWWPTVLWAGIVCIVLIGNYFGYKRRESRDRMLEKFAEHGQALPPSLMVEFGGSRNSFTFAFVLIATGIALSLFFWAMTGGGGFKGEPGVPNWLPALGLFPLLIGIAKLFGTLADRRKEEREKPD